MCKAPLFHVARLSAVAIAIIASITFKDYSQGEKLIDNIEHLVVVKVPTKIYQQALSEPAPVIMPEQSILNLNEVSEPEPVPVVVEPEPVVVQDKKVEPEVVVYAPPQEFKDFLKKHWSPAIIEVNNGDTVPVTIKKDGDNVNFRLPEDLHLTKVNQDNQKALVDALAAGVMFTDDEKSNLVHKKKKFAQISFDESKMRFSLDMDADAFDTVVQKNESDVKYLGKSGGEMGGVVNYRAYLNGGKDHTNYNVNFDFLHSFGESYIDVRTSLNNNKNKFTKAALTRDFEGTSLDVGFLGFASTGSKFSDFSAAESRYYDYYGLSYSSDEKTIITDSDKQEESEIPILLYLNTSTTIEVLRGGDIINVQEFESGIKQLDTKLLPSGIYEVTLKFYEDGKLDHIETHTIYKSKIMQQPKKYRFSLGAAKYRSDLDDNQHSDKLLPWMSGYYKHRLPRMLAFGFGGELISDDLKVYLQLDKTLFGMTFRNGVMLGDNQTYKYRGLVSGMLYGTAYSMAYSNGRKVKDNVDEKSDYVNDSFTVNLSKRFYTGGRLSVNHVDANYDGQLEKRYKEPGRSGEYRLTYGNTKTSSSSVRYSHPFRITNDSNVDVYIVAKRQIEQSARYNEDDDSISVGFNLTYNQNENYTYKASGRTDSRDGYTVTGEVERKYQDSMLSKSNVSVSDYNHSSNIKARGELEASSLRGTGSLGYNHSKHDHSSYVSSSVNLNGGVAYTGQTVGTYAKRSETGLIVNVTGLAEGDEIEVNGKVVTSNGKMYVPLNTYNYEKLYVRMTNDSRYFYNVTDFDGQDLGARYKGDVNAIELDLHRGVEILARIIDEDGQPITDAVVENHVGESATDTRGYFSMPVSYRTPMLTVFSGNSTCNVSISRDLLENTKGIALVGDLECHTKQPSPVIVKN